MKKHSNLNVIILVGFLVLCMLSCFAGGGDNENTRENKDVVAVDGTDSNKEENDIDNSGEKNNETPIVDEAYNFKEQVLLDRDGIRITAKSIEKSWAGTSLNVLVENDSETNITVQTRDSIVNGIMVDTWASIDIVAGKKANDSITFTSSDVKTAGIDIFKDISLKFHVFNSDDWNTIFDTEQISFTANDDVDYTQKYDDSGIEVLNRDGFRIVAKQMNSKDSFWGADLYLYIENNSGKDATIQVRDVSINDFMVDPYFSCDILNGAKAFDSITFMESDFKENGITDIKTLELSFHVFDKESWKSIFDTETIKINF